MLDEKQLLVHETINQNYVSDVFLTDGISTWTLIVAMSGTPTGTTPTITWAVQNSADGVNFSQVGPGLTPMTPSLMHQATQYASDTAQGAVSGPFFRVVGVLGGTNPVFPDVSADITAQDQ